MGWYRRQLLVLNLSGGGAPGTGDVVGPASSVDGRPALFDGTTGKLLKQASAALGTAAFAATTDFLAAAGTAADVNPAGTSIAAALSGKLGTSGTAADVNPAGTSIAAALSGKLSTSGTAADVNPAGTSIAAALSGKLSTSGTAADVNPAGTSIAAALAGKQASGSYVTDPGSNGILSRTAASTVSARTITGTAGTAGVTVTNGDGVSGNPTIKAPGVIVLPFVVTGGANTIWTNMPAAATFFLGATASGGRKLDLTNYTECRIVRYHGSTAGNTGSKIVLKYKATSFSLTPADYSDIGTSEVSTATDAASTYYDTGWITLAAGAKADVWVALIGSGGDGVIDPVFGYCEVHFR